MTNIIELNQDWNDFVKEYSNYTIEKQVELINKDRSIYFDLPTELIKTAHAQAAILQFRSHLFKIISNMPKSGRREALELWTGGYILNVIKKAPVDQHTSEMLLQAAIGNIFKPANYQPTLKKSVPLFIFKPFLEKHPLITKSLCEDLVDINPWLIYSLPEKFIDRDTRRIARDNGLSICHANEKRAIKNSMILEDFVQKFSNNSRKINLNSVKFNKEIADILNSLAYDKFYETNVSAFKNAWNNFNLKYLPKINSWELLSPTEKDENIFLAIEASGIDQKMRKRLYSELEWRLSNIDEIHNLEPKTIEINQDPVKVQAVEINSTSNFEFKTAPTQDNLSFKESNIVSTSSDLNNFDDSVNIIKPENIKTIHLNPQPLPAKRMPRAILRLKGHAAMQPIIVAKKPSSSEPVFKVAPKIKPAVQPSFSAKPRGFTDFINSLHSTEVSNGMNGADLASLDEHSLPSTGHPNGCNTDAMSSIATNSSTVTTGNNVNSYTDTTEKDTKPTVVSTLSQKIQSNEKEINASNIVNNNPIIKNGNDSEESIQLVKPIKYESTKLTRSLRSTSDHEDYEVSINECTNILKRSIVIDHVEINAPSPNIDPQPVEFKFLYTPHSNKFHIIGQQGEWRKLFECTPGKFPKDATLIVESVDASGDLSYAGFGVIKNHQMQFMLKGFEKFSCQLDVNELYYHNFKFIEVEEVKPVKVENKMDYELNDDDLFTDEDLNRLRGNIDTRVFATMR